MEKQKPIQYFILILTVLIVFTSCTYGTSSPEKAAENTNPEQAKASKTEEIDLSSPVKNSGPAARQGDYLYYATNYLYRKNLNTGEETLLDDNPVTPKKMHLQDGWVYFLQGVNYKDALFKVRVDGKEKTLVTHDDVFVFHVAGDFIYYTVDNNYEMYSIKTDGTGKMKLTEDYSYYLHIVGDYIYYTNYSDIGNVYKIKNDSTGRMKISDWRGVIKKILDGRIYYADIHDNPTWLTSVGLNGEDKKIFREAFFIIDVIGDWIYYGGPEGLGKVKTYGTERTRLEIDEAAIAEICDGWIYYVNVSFHNPETNGNVYKIRTDGTEKTRLYDGQADFSELHVLGDIILFDPEPGFTYWKVMKTDGTDLGIIK